MGRTTISPAIWLLSLTPVIAAAEFGAPTGSVQPPPKLTVKLKQKLSQASPFTHAFYVHKIGSRAVNSTCERPPCRRSRLRWPQARWCASVRGSACRKVCSRAH